MQQLDDQVFVSGQIRPDQMDELRCHGVTMIVNNRPDHEDDGQPTAAEIEAAAHQSGLAYRFVPIRRGPGPAEVEAMREAMSECVNGRMLAFCRSGARSTWTWALARRAEGMECDEVERRAAQAGVSLAPIAHLL